MIRNASESISVLQNQSSINTNLKNRGFDSNKVFPDSPTKNSKRMMSIRLTLALPSMQIINEEKLYGQEIGHRFSILSKFLFFHILYYCRVLRNAMVVQNRSINYSDLPKLQKSVRIDAALENACYLIQNNNHIVWTDIVKLIFLGKLFPIVLISSSGFLLECISKNLVSIMLSMIITDIEQQNISDAYIHTTIMIILNLVAMFGRNYGYLYGMLFSSKARMLLINAIYFKLTELSSFSLMEANAGKIINLVSSDINQLEKNLSTVLQITILPVSLLFGSIIIWIRFNGIIGLLAFAIIFLSYPLLVLINNSCRKYLMGFQLNGDHRIKLINEFIDGIRMVKMYTWEQPFIANILNFRRKEYISILFFQIGISIQRSISQSSHIWASVIFFLILHYGEFIIDLSIADMISTIQLLSYFKYSCVVMVQLALITYLLIKNSFTRIAEILSIQNINMTSIKLEESQFDQNNYREMQGIQGTEPSLRFTEEQNLNSPIMLSSQNYNTKSSPKSKSKRNPSIHLDNFTMYWCKQTEISNNKPTLKSISLTIRSGEFWVIYGHVGCGKSTLLKSIIGEIPAYTGTFNILDNLNIAFVEQEPFLFPDTLRNNILFGRPYDPVLYEKVLQATCLWTDIIHMSAKDLTDIREKGVNLSGGQRARIALARALYTLADIYLLDDPLSAVDASVSKSIYQETIQKFIQDYQCEQLPNRPDPIIILVTSQVQLAMNCDKIGVMESGEIICQGRHDQIDYFQKFHVHSDRELQFDSDQNSDSNDGSELTSQLSESRFFKYEKVKEEKIVQITYQSYKRYLSYWGIKLFSLVILLNIGYAITYQVFLRIISDFHSYPMSEAFFIIGLLTIFGIIFNILKYCLTAFGTQKANQSLHKLMLITLSKLPVNYFDKTPSGRILSKFSNDLNVGDNQTFYVLIDILEILITFFVSLITFSILQQYFLLIMFGLIVLNVLIVKFYKEMISQLKEIELMQRGPVFDYLKKTLGGIVQIRVYNQQFWFRHQFLKITNKLYKSILTFYYVSRSFEFNIDLVGQLVQIIGLYLILILNSGDISSFSQQILLLLTFNETLQWGLRQLITFQTQMNSFERIYHLIDEKQEQQKQTNIPHFPGDGSIEFQEVNLKYRKDQELILKNLTLFLKGGQRIACVGRSGSGKSSIVQALFRMVEIQQNKDSFIKIGGINTKSVGVLQIRSSIGIIPQSPFIFTGSIRQNVDPNNSFSDEEIWQALKDTSLSDYVLQLPNNLNCLLNDQNSVLSVGQKQLISLARLILNPKKIIILDEATSNLDIETDEFIQEIIKQKFQSSTILTIAHRLNTIADYDLVIVMKDGLVIEYDNPFDLLCQDQHSETIDQDTEFARLILKTGITNSEKILEIAKQAYNKRLCECQGQGT